MHSKWVFKHFYPWSNKQLYHFVFLWVLGLLLGALLCGRAPYAPDNILYGAITTEPSMLALFLVCTLPILFSASAVRPSLLPVSYLFIFLGALSHGFCGTAIYVAVGSASWLLRPMLLFSAGCTSVLMWWLLIQNSTGRRARKSIRLAFCLSGLIYIIDLFLVSPLVSDLINVLLEGFA